MTRFTEAELQSLSGPGAYWPVTKDNWEVRINKLAAELLEARKELRDARMELSGIYSEAKDNQTFMGVPVATAQVIVCDWLRDRAIQEKTT